MKPKSDVEHKHISEKCLVVFFDVYGFSEIVRIMSRSKRLANENMPFGYPYKNSGSLLSSLTKIWKWVSHNVDTDEVIPYLFSDCGFLFYRVRNRGQENEIVLTQCIENLELLMNQYPEEGFFVRGGVSFGQVSYTRHFFVGEPVIEAHKLESLYCPGPFIIIPNREIAKICKEEPFIKQYSSYILTAKEQKGEMKCTIVFPSDRELYLRKLEDYANWFLEKGPFEHAKFWHETYLFVRGVLDRS